jgi:hypothetical protein
MFDTPCVDLVLHGNLEALENHGSLLGWNVADIVALLGPGAAS